MYFLLRSLLLSFFTVFVIISLNQFTLVKCNFCYEDLLDTNSSEEVMFTKELSNVEFGIGRHSKTLHCCATNHKAILWFKGDKLYPWKDGESNFVLDPKSNNQTLYVNELAKHDAGTYSCYIMGNSNYRSRHIPLTVFEIDYTGFPKKTYNPPAKEFVDLDGTARLYCETFVGKIYLPDAQSKINWYKLRNGKRVLLPEEDDRRRISVKKVTRDSGQTIGMYLIIKQVDLSDSGQYVCSVSNTDDQITDTMSEIAINESIFTFSEKQQFLGFVIIATLIVLIMVIIFVYVKYRFEFQLYMRQWIKTEKKVEQKNLQHDIFIYYEPKQLNFLNRYLMPRLIEDRHKVTTRALEAHSAITMDSQFAMALSRRTLVILSTEDITNLYSQRQFSQKLYLLSTMPSHITCILVVETPESLNPECRTWLNSMNFVKVIVWSLYKSDQTNMWRALRVYLPMRNKPTKEEPDLCADDRHILYLMN